MSESSLSRLDLRGIRRPLIESDIPRPDAVVPETVDTVREIVAGVRDGGDSAVASFTERFDGVRSERMIYDPRDFEAAFKRIPQQLRDAMSVAAEQIRTVYREELPPEPTTKSRGVTVVRRSVPVERAGCYVPGGAARYPSSVLHTAVIAKVAGVGEVVVATPPMADGSIDDPTLAACHVAEVDWLVAAGGAQAIAALAFGTESIPKVDVIVGPGNLYVSLAKQEVARYVGVPSAFAGPSEVVVVADASVKPVFAALDVAVQAEHGPHGLAWLVTWDEVYAEEVESALAAYLAEAPRAREIQQTLDTGGYLALVRDREQAIELSNLIAPEHLELLYGGGLEDSCNVENAGVVFVGPYASAAFGDYVAGPSHVLPTYGTARFASVLSVEDFTKRLHTIVVEHEGLRDLGWAVEEIAAIEGLSAHAASIAVRRRGV